MKEKLANYWIILKKILLWSLFIAFIYLMFTVKIMSPINEVGNKGICINLQDAPCSYSLQIQY